MRFGIGVAVLVVASLAGPVAAQDLAPKAAPQRAPIAIVHATIHPVSGPVIERGYVRFEGGRITAVAAGEGEFGADVERVDGTGLHVYPGLIAAHTDLGLTEIDAVRAMRDEREVGALKPEVRAAVAVNPDSTLIPVARANGVLAFAAFPTGGDIPGRASVLTVDGWTWEDMTALPDAGLVVSWPVPRDPVQDPRRRRRDPENEPPPYAERLQRIKEAFDAARAYAAARAADPATPSDVRWEAMRPALTRERPVFLLADDYDQIVSAVWFAARYGVRPVVVGGRDAWQCVDHLKRFGAAVIVDGVHRFPKRRDSDYDEVYRLPARLEAAGIPWCLASGEPSWNERNLAYTAARAVAYGLDPDVAVAAITLYPARILGLEGVLGSLDVGKRATLIVTDGNPLEVTTRVLRAFVDGRAIDLASKQQRLYEKYREKYRQLGILR